MAWLLQSVKTTGSNGKTVYPVSAINVLKAHGKSARESALLNGYALNMGRASQGMPKRVANAKIACLDMNLQKARMHMGIQVIRAAATMISTKLQAWAAVRAIVTGLLGGRTMLLLTRTVMCQEINSHVTSPQASPGRLLLHDIGE